MDEIERFYGGEARLQTSHYLGVIRGHLNHLMRLLDIRLDVLHALGAISDFAYGWGPLKQLIPSLQIKVGNLRYHNHLLLNKIFNFLVNVVSYSRRVQNSVMLS